jgi:hypothetical protein
MRILARRSGIAWTDALVGLSLLVTALIVAWHVDHALRAGALWRDEAHVVNWASFPSLAEVWSNRHLDAFPATWPLLIHGWLALAGASDASLRTLGALIGLAGLAALWWTARQFGCRAPLFALVLYAANPCVLVFGDSVRGYGLGLFALVLFVGAVGAVIARPGWKTVAGAELAALFAAHTDFRNCVFVLAALVAAAAAAALRRRWKVAALVLALGALPAASLLPYLSSYRIVSEWIVIWKRDWGYAALFDTFLDALRTAGTWAPWVWCLMVVLALAACAREILAPCDRPTAQDRARFFLIALAIGVPGYFLLLDSLRLVTQIWYYQSLIAVLALCIDGALVLGSGTSRWATVAKFALASGAIALGAAAASDSRGFVLTNVDAIAARLERDAAPEDLVLVARYLTSPSFERYYRGPTPWITLPEVRHRHFQDPASFKEKMSRQDPIRPELDRIAATLRAGHRVWWVGDLWEPDPAETGVELPPAPRAETGWDDGPYLRAWSTQAIAALAREARAIRSIVPRREGPVNPFENTQLFVAEPRRARGAAGAAE